MVVKKFTFAISPPDEFLFAVRCWSKAKTVIPVCLQDDMKNNKYTGDFPTGLYVGNLWDASPIPSDVLTPVISDIRDERLFENRQGYSTV